MDRVYQVEGGRLLAWVFLAFCGVLLSLGVVYLSPLKILGLSAGIILFGASLFRPELGILGFIVLSSTILDLTKLPYVSVGMGSLHVPDMLLLFLLSVIPLRILIHRIRLVKSPLSITLLLFFIGSFISIFTSLRLGGKPEFISIYFRAACYYLLFFAVTNLVQDKKQLRLLAAGLIFLAFGVSIAAVLQALVGPSLRLIPGRVETLSTLAEEVRGINRILPPGQTLVFAMSIVLGCLIVLDKPNAKHMAYYLIFGFLAAGNILAFSRSTWISICVSMLILFILASRKQEMKILRIFIFALSLAVIIVLSVKIADTGIYRYITSSYSRAASLFSGKMKHSGTLTTRYKEIRYAVKSIKKHPVMGIGLGNTYRPGIWKKDKGYYAHNGYIWILLKTGLVGFIPFLFFLLIAIIQGFRNFFTIKDNFLKTLALGASLAIIAICISSQVNPLFMQDSSIPVIAILAGFIDVAGRIYKKEYGNLN